MLIAERRIFLDFETYSECDLMACGSYEYAFHKSTEVICMGYDLSDGKGVRLWRGPRFPQPEPFPEELVACLRSGPCEIWAHNAEFDQAIWYACVCQRNPGIPMPRVWRCSSVLCRSCGLPGSLSKAALELGLSQHKDTRGAYLIRKLSVPQKGSSKDLFDADLYNEMGEYCCQDVRVLRSLVESLPNIPPFEWSLFDLTTQMNARGVRVDRVFCEIANQLAEKEVSRLNSVVQEVTGGAASGVTKREDILNWIRSRGIGSMMNMQAATIDSYLKRSTLPEDIRTVLESRREGSKTSLVKYAKALDRSNVDGRLRGELVFYGAQTGRWSSRGVQLQNIPRGAIANMDLLVESLMFGSYPCLWPRVSLLTLLSWALRGILVADEGKQFLALDYASIEARAVLWLSGNNLAMETFRSGGDIYKTMAAQIYQKPVEEITKEERRVGKQAVLGLGYGMGVRGFFEKCEKDGLTGITPEFADLIVSSYRKDLFPDVPAMWADIEDAARGALRGRSTMSHRVRFELIGRFLHCWLPSGRSLRYFNPRLDRDGIVFSAYDEGKGMADCRLWGGALMENISSGMCRDLMAAALQSSVNHGLTPVLTVHDEIVLEAPMTTTMEEFRRIVLGASPAWADGFPLDVDGWSGKRYRK